MNPEKTWLVHVTFADGTESRYRLDGRLTTIQKKISAVAVMGKKDIHDILYVDASTVPTKDIMEELEWLDEQFLTRMADASA